MTSRDRILKSIEAIPLEWVDLTLHCNQENTKDSIYDLFKERLEMTGGKVFESDSYDFLQGFEQNDRVVNGIKGRTGYNLDYMHTKDAKDLNDVHTVLLKANIAVAENGAIWVTNREMGNSVLPFICEELVLVVDKSHIVYSMHDAYHLIGDDDYQFGVFIAGPSKTADIEQSLVIGAHGPLSLKVYVINL